MVITSLGCSDTKKENTPWIPIFDGKTLDGWTIKGGEAHYEVRDEIIVGSTVHDTPNTFLTTDRMYSDFILELDYKVDSTMNSGIQIRSNSFPHYRNGRVHGYQIEIDPSDRAWSAGIYDEARRGWLNTMDNNPKAQQAFKQNDWNHYRIEALGDTLKTWINDVPASYLIDDKTSNGFIGLQVHSIGKDQQAGTEIQWKNIRILTDSLAKYARKSTLTPIITKNQLTIDEEKNGWKLLWDGSTTNGWRGARLDDFPAEGWIIENGELIVLSSGGEESTAGGDIVTDDLYGNFELQLDFKLTKGANSGIKYFVDTDLNKGPGSSIGLEYQILDDDNHPDAKLGNHEGSRTLASLYDLIMVDPDKPVNPIGEWNHARILSKDNHVEHWLNGMKVLEYERKSDLYKKLVSESKYKIWPNFGESDQGHILLQDHGDRVAFKNIKIRPILSK
ncbi:3-keto-disaccharide hydrolase [Eudoraea sp.]|uniref:3-keto-disaccharide hydrolase n=1 Tax=Eudoraea sp. TaxID=1979955 RepID=UPI003C725369